MSHALTFTATTTNHQITIPFMNECTAEDEKKLTDMNQSKCVWIIIIIIRDKVR